MFVGFIWVRQSKRSFVSVQFIHARFGGGRVHLGYSCSFGRASRVVEFIRARPRVGWVHASATFGQRVHAGSLCLFERAQGDLVFIRVRWVHSGVSLGWSGSFGFVRFVHYTSLGHALSVVRFGWVNFVA